MTFAADDGSWPAARAGEALEALTRATGLVAETPSLAAFPPPSASRDDLARWIDAAAEALGLEAEALSAPYAEASRVVRGGPALLYVRSETDPRVFAVLGARARGDQVRIVAPDHVVTKVPARRIEDALLRHVEVAGGARVDAILARAGLPDAAHARARQALLREPYGRTTLEAGWTLRLPPSAPFFTQVRAAHLPGDVLAMLGGTLAAQALTLVGWWLMGRGALGGRLDRGWLLAWALLMLTLVPIRVAVAWRQGALGIEASALMKRRLLLGALRLDPEETRHQGTGQLLGRVIESEAVEALALGGGFATLLAIVDLATAFPVVAAGPGGGIAALLLALWTAVSIALTVRLFVRYRAWSRARLSMTHDLVERMVGHRTRLAQEPPSQWHDDEDRVLADYVERSAALDRTSTLTASLLARGWLIVGILALVPAFVGGGASPALVAVGVGGILLARGALGRMSGGLSSLLNASIAWEQAGPLFRAAARKELAAAPSPEVLALPRAAAGETLLHANDVVFRYRAKGDPVLRKASLRIHARDRLLVQGPSGGGKSTFGSILTGLRAPESGLVLLGGLDRPTLGSNAWRRRVVAAPQFHENHVLSNTLAFNLLMGRGWPPSARDLEEADAVCRELGLGPLLDRMPAGLMQTVGETGWQLSHGEQSRVYLARALLQDAELVVLDESFAALDPETLRLALRATLARASTLMVIAHP